MQNRFKGIGAWVAIFIVVYLLYSFVANSLNASKTMIYSDFVSAVKQNKVSEFVINGTDITAKISDESGEKTYKIQIPSQETLMTDVGEDLREQMANGTVKQEAYQSKISSSLVIDIITLIVFLLLAFMLFTRRGGGGAGGFTKSRAKVGYEGDAVKFSDVAGADEEKEELAEVVEFLKNPRKFINLGARIPKGILLVGSPGTGKTLLARAVAGEAGVPFFSISGSDFVELYVGVGASRVRDLFEQAKKNKPCIIFIDEIDAVGRQRGAGVGGGHDEREQTLNQLLVEMDGFGKNDGIIVIAATNRPDILDRALLRPGRFDRRVVVDLPDMKGREEILKIHSRKKPLASDVDLGRVARETIGYSGADLENLMNEASIFAARREHVEITNKDIEDANLKVMMGTEKRSKKVSEKEKRLTAYHEAGHAVLAQAASDGSKVQRVSIIPRGRAGGFTMNVPDEDETFNSKKKMLNQIVMLLGGRAAEALKLDDISTGASNDLERATHLAKQMTVKYGMSDEIGPVSYESGGEVFVGRDFGHTKDYSEDTAAQIDKEVKRILTEQYDKAKALLKKYDAQLEAVARCLMDRETINGEEFLECFNSAVKGEEINAGN
ncbi:MAG: ATP-dependent zinc metalloprotease FtsH [Firmicutes bacterium]|nr:ATP-dependent zinc metalloprotease FtsH [Bacillota bacterium]